MNRPYASIFRCYYESQNYIFFFNVMFSMWMIWFYFVLITPQFSKSVSIIMVYLPIRWLNQLGLLQSDHLLCSENVVYCYRLVALASHNLGSNFLLRYSSNREMKVFLMTVLRFLLLHLVI